MSFRGTHASEMGSPGGLTSRPTIQRIQTSKSLMSSTIFRKSLSRLKSSTDNRDGESSDEENLTPAVGCISWHCEITKGRVRDQKYIYLDPVSGMIFQQGRKSQKSFNASSITELSFLSDESINVCIKRPGDIAVKTRVYSFADSHVANEFKYTMEYINEFGEFIKHAYRKITGSESAPITIPLLQTAMLSQDIHASGDDIQKMMTYFGEEGLDTIDFMHFFLIFPNTYVRTLRECLLEWLRRIRLNETDVLSGLDMNDNGSISGENIFRDNVLEIPPMLPGERRICNSISHIRWSICAPKAVGTTAFDQFNTQNNESYLGNIHFTNYRIIVTSTSTRDALLYGKPHSRYYIPEYFSQLSIPLNTVHRYQTAMPGSMAAQNTTKITDGSNTTVNIVNNNPIGSPAFLYVVCKDVRVLKLILYPGRLSIDALRHSENSTPTGSVRSETDSMLGSPRRGRLSSFGSSLKKSNLDVAARERNEFVSCLSVGDLVGVLQKYTFPFSYTKSSNGFLSPLYTDKLLNGQTQKIPNLFAFGYMKGIHFQENGWELSDVLKDYVRQGLLGMNGYRVVDNSSWQFCETYPSHLVIPAPVPSSYLQAIGQFRSKKRIPVVTYLHRATRAVLTRSSQPMVGVMKKKCNEDVELLNYYRLKGTGSAISSSQSDKNRGSNSNMKVTGLEIEPKMYIFDLRSYVAATANLGRGGGVEDVTQYKNTELVFGNCENIHAVRGSLAMLADVVSPGAGEEDIGYLYHSKLDETNWLKHIRLLLNSSTQVAEKLHLEASSVLVHCSDGWDRTAQVTSLVQVMLDPYYRTLEGIAVLIEKEWCGFGHKFHDRCGHGVDHNTNAEEKSPVFIQFLDCLMQILVQFPNSFEFNTFLIIFVADHAYSALFGNFLCNSEKQRKSDLRVFENTQSIWSYVYEYSERFVNSHFEPYFDCIWPNTSIKHIALWERYYCRWDPKLHPNSLNIWDQWHDDWGNGYETVYEIPDSADSTAGTPHKKSNSFDV